MFARTFVQLFLLVSLVGQLSAAPIYQQHGQILRREPVGTHGTHGAVAALAGHAGFLGTTPIGNMELEDDPTAGAKSGLHGVKQKIGKVTGHLNSLATKAASRAAGSAKNAIGHIRRPSSVSSKVEPGDEEFVSPGGLD